MIGRWGAYRRARPRRPLVPGSLLAKISKLSDSSRNRWALAHGPKRHACRITLLRNCNPYNKDVQIIMDYVPHGVSRPQCLNILKCPYRFAERVWKWCSFGLWEYGAVAQVFCQNRRQRVPFSVYGAIESPSRPRDEVTISIGKNTFFMAFVCNGIDPTITKAGVNKEVVRFVMFYEVKLGVLLIGIVAYVFRDKHFMRFLNSDIPKAINICTSHIAIPAAVQNFK